MHNRFVKTALLFLSVALLCVGQQVTAQLSGAKGNGITPISGVEPTLPDDELSVFDSLARSATIIALGEVVHGSAALLKLEHRLTRYFVEKHGYRLIILENPIIRSEGLTRWLAECPDTEPPMDLYYMPVKEDRDFIRWICSFNRQHLNDPIRFRGMDIWDRPWQHQQRMEALASKLGLEVRAQLNTARQHCWVHNDSDWDNYSNNLLPYIEKNKQISPSDYVPCMDALNDVRNKVNTFITNEAGSDRLYSAYHLLQSVDTAIGYQGTRNHRYGDFGKRWNSRDLAQARNEYSIWLQEGKRKAIIIGHTSHTSKMESESDWWKKGLGKFRSGVSYLREKLGDKVMTIGLTGYELTGTQGEFAKAVSEDSLDLTLHKLGINVAVVNPYGSFVRQRERWWVHNENSDEHYINGVYMVPRDNFDLFVFVNKSFKGEAIEPWRPLHEW